MDGLAQPQPQQQRQTDGEEDDHNRNQTEPHGVRRVIITLFTQIGRVAAI
jgi:hypothetical protein